MPGMALIAPTVVFLLVVIETGQAVSNHKDIPTNEHPQFGFKPEHKDQGYVRNCGPGGGYFNVSWYPKKPNPTENLKVFVHLKSPVDMDTATLNFEIWYEGNPFVSGKRQIRCEEGEQLLHNLANADALPLNCPIRKGQLLSGHYMFTNVERMIGFDGQYKLKATLTDQRGRLLLCADMDVEIMPVNR